MKRCVLCRQPFAGFGNNPYPVKDEGQCCNYCNAKEVIPRRIELAAKTKAAMPANATIVSREQDDYQQYLSNLAEGVRQAADPVAALLEIYLSESLVTLATVLKRINEG